MVPRANKNSGYAKICKAKKAYYGIFLSGLLLECRCLQAMCRPAFIKIFHFSHTNCPLVLLVLVTIDQYYWYSDNKPGFD